MAANPRRCITWLLTGLFCLTAALYASAEEQADLPNVIYLEQNGTKIRVDYSDYLKNRGGLMLGGGCYQVVLSALVEQGTDPSSLFTGLQVAPVLLGGQPDMPGGSWSDLWVHRVCFNENEVTVEDTVGPDTVLLQVPLDGVLEAASGQHQEVYSRVVVNHHSVPFSQAYVDQLAAAVTSGYVPQSLLENPGMAELASHLDRDGWYFRAMPVLADVRRVVGDHYVVPPHTGLKLNGCWKPCLNCAALSGGLLIALPAVAASCGATAGAGCLAGGVGVMRLAVGTVTSCSDCLDCRRGGGGGIGGGCKQGYHDCCEGKCCRDGSPPPDCGPQ